MCHPIPYTLSRAVWENYAMSGENVFYYALCLARKQKNKTRQTYFKLVIIG